MIAGAPRPGRAAARCGSVHRLERQARRASGAEIIDFAGWGTWIRTKIDGVRVRCSTVELSPNGRFKRGFARWRGVVNSEARRAAQAHAASGCERLRPAAVTSPLKAPDGPLR